MTLLLMKPTSAGKDTQHERDQTLKKLACVSNQWGPLLTVPVAMRNIPLAFKLHNYK
ncbi:hypothetical protein GMA8713_04367 [Grimontia marina]|uniref:Uncharacterized protein n=1 Tax=Grimontia marina TaxID=646534 RepID=A0A128FHQ9_9GAMM|nr:hypothetical protein GMA8713_04367 [Grimontia marina]